MFVSRAFELVVSRRNLRFLCRFGQLANIVEEVMVEAFCGRWTLSWVYLEHELEQVFEHAVLLSPLVVNYIVEQEHA